MQQYAPTILIREIGIAPFLGRHAQIRSNKESALVQFARLSLAAGVIQMAGWWFETIWNCNVLGIGSLGNHQSCVIVILTHLRATTSSHLRVYQASRVDHDLKKPK